MSWWWAAEACPTRMTWLKSLVDHHSGGVEIDEMDGVSAFLYQFTGRDGCQALYKRGRGIFVC